MASQSRYLVIYLCLYPDSLKFKRDKYKGLQGPARQGQGSRKPTWGDIAQLQVSSMGQGDIAGNAQTQAGTAGFAVA